MASLNKCSGCNKNFAGASIHALHRVGKFGVDRRCLTTEELLAKGWTSQVEPVKRRIDGKEHVEQMETWYQPMTDERRAALDAWRQEQTGEEVLEEDEREPEDELIEQ